MRMANRFGGKLRAALLLLAVAATGGAFHGSTALADEAPRATTAALPNVPAAIEQLMQDRKYDEAVKAIDAAIEKKQGDADYLSYLKGRALHFAEKYDAAIAAFDELQKQYPNSSWARRGRFAKALSHTRKGQFREAELIYRAEAEYLLSLDRKQEIVDIYLEFADALFKPAKEDVEPDYSSALEFYQRALEVGPKPESRVTIELKIAECYEHIGDYAEATAHYEAFLRDHADHSLAIEARYHLGQVHLDNGDLEAARRVWQDLLALHAGSESPRMADAAYHLAETYNMPTPEDDEQLNLGIATLRTFLAKYPEHELAGDAYRQIVEAQYNRQRYDDAVKTAQAYLADERFKDRESTPVIASMLGYAFLMQGEFDKALEAWREFLAKHPTHSAWSRVQSEIVNAEFLKAQAAYQDERFADARRLWSEFLAKYPLDGRNATILFRFGQIEYEQQQWDEAIAEWRRLISKYPQSQEAQRAQFTIAATLEEKLGQLDKALEAFREVTGSMQNAAGQRIARLTAQSLKVATERVFRTNETPQIQVTTRNLEKVQVAIYTVDLETYFRKMHLARGIEQLDTALIDPDASFEYAIPDYQAYQKYENSVEIPLPEPDVIRDEANRSAGVMIVTVSCDTCEATTLVLRSDLDIVVKSSRDELFVFAENLRTGKPWPKARVLVSNGQQVFAEATTDDNGVLQQTYDELKSADDVRVFAISDGHTASNVVGLSGVGVAQGLSAKGFLFTERPAYRPGQMVHVRGIVRDVMADTYQVPAGREYRLEIHDTRNRLIHEAEVSLNDFGTFHDNFLLPEGAAQGDYRIDLRAGEREAYQGAFAVHDYQLQPTLLEIDTERTIFYRGEEIEGTIRAAYYYGAPLIGREITYQLQGGRSYTATTDERGEVHFTLATREYRESQALVMVASLPTENLHVSRQFYLSTVGFSLDLQTTRETYLAGETFELTVRATDAEGEPAAETVRVTVLRQSKVGNKLVETNVAEHEVKTDDDGQTRVTLKLDEGGEYLLRAEGTDRFGNPISHQRPLHISGEEDSVRLRILADKHTYRVGDNAAVTLHWREKPALALLTFEGARILDYQLVPLKTGENKLTLPMNVALAPNFELAVAVMTDDVQPPKHGGDASRFHSAASPFTVIRELKVDVKLHAKGNAERSPRPGEEAEVTITTRDAQGKPVAAELSLAMVEQSLLKRYPQAARAIDAFFRGADRQSAMKTTASVTFQYQPKTKHIDAAVLAERERLEREALESRRLDELADAGGAVALDDLFAAPPSPADDPFGVPGAGEVSGNGQVPATEFAYGNAMLGADGVPANGPAIYGPFGGGYGMGGGGAMGGIGGGMGGMGAGFGAPQAELPQSNGDFEGRIDPFRSNLSLQVQQSLQLKDGANLGDRLSQVNTWGALSQRGLEAFEDKGKAANKSRELSNVVRFQVQASNGGEVRELFLLNNTNELQAVQADGTWFNVNVDAKKQANVEALVKQLASEGVVLLPGLRPHETGYWNPAVTTDEEGRAVITFTLPERSTAWSLRAVGITTETLAGEASTEFAASKPLFGQLKLPAALTDGDTAQVEATIHNDALDKGEIEVTLKTTIGDKSVTQRQTINVTKKSIESLSFAAEIAAPPADGGQPGGEALFELTVTAGEQRDVVSRLVPIRPYGLPVFAIAGGSAESDALATVEPPANMTLGSPTLQVIVGPTVERSLLDAILAPPAWCQFESSLLASGVETTTSDLMAAIALQKLFGGSRDAGHPQAELLDARIRSSISSLVALQTDDGGWIWAGATNGNQSRGAGQAYMSARAMWALSLARKAGYRVDDTAFDMGLNYLRTELAKAAVADYETKAVLLHALSSADRGDFTLANQLYRNRPSLSSAGLAYLALAFAEMDRDPTANELLAMVAERKFADASRPALAWLAAPTELRAIYALALERVAPNDVRLREQIEWLMAHRTGSRWSPDKATGPAMLAACRWYERTRFAGDAYKLTVFVNDLQAGELNIDASSLTQTIDVPANLLKAGKQSVRFTLTGRGRYTYQCVLGGFVPGDKLKATTDDWYVNRTIEPAPLERDGQPIPRGFDIVRGNYKFFRNPLTDLNVGRRGHVELRVGRRGETPETNRAYLVVTEPLPAGVSVVENSVRGGFERFEQTAGAITFFIGNRDYASIEYDVHGYLPGDYRTAPTVVRDAYRPDQMAVTGPHALDVLAVGEASRDTYRLTPRELFELGKREFDAGNLAAAGAHLTQLLNDWTINDAEYRESVRMLLDVHLKNGPAADVVRYFEIIIEKYPDLEIPFGKLVQVADAYHEIAEYERSYLVFRATIEASFLRESQIGGFLEQQDEFLRSVDVISSLQRQYPPEPYLATAEYALAQGIYAKGLEAADDPKLRAKKITRVDLVQQARRRLDTFLTAYPNDPAADQASFSLANAMLELELYERTIQRCQQFAERYPDSEYLDSYWYVIGFCHFALGQHEQALAMCRKVAETRVTDPASGQTRDSNNKWRAIYILGQIYHSLGEAAQAITEYRRVDDRFADARQAIDYFLHKELQLPDVTTFKPGEAAQVELGFRNIAEVDTAVYRIDLLKFSLLRRDLSDITNINLAGIRPYYEARLKLGDGRDYRDRTTKLELPLKDEGAYLVVCRGENLYASGMVLVTPLGLEVQEEVSSGQVRATVRNVVEDRYKHDVLVKVIGSRGNDFVSGKTDLRGVFVAEGILGRSMVIAQSGDGRYAFYRGERDLGPQPQPNLPSPDQQAAEPAQAATKAGGAKGELLEGLRSDNGIIIEQQQMNLNNFYNNDVKSGIGGGFGGGFF